MDYFSELNDEASIASQYEEQLNELNGQKNQVADTLNNLKTTYKDELYNYGVGLAGEKAENLQNLLDVGVDAGAIAGIKALGFAYEKSGAKALVGRGVQKIKDYYDGYAEMSPPDIAEPPRIPDEAIPMETFSPATETSDAFSGVVGNVTEQTLENVADQNVAVSAFNTEIGDEVASGALTANPDQTIAETSESVADANTADTGGSAMASEELGESEASTAINTVQSSASSSAGVAAGESAEDLAESGLGDFAETEAAENALDFTGVGEALAIGSAIGEGIKDLFNWLDPPAPPPPPPPPTAPKFQPYVEAPTFISSQVQSGL